MKSRLIEEVDRAERSFMELAGVLLDEDSGFKATPGGLSVAEQVARVGQVIDWFADSMDRPEGIDLDFEMHWLEVKGFRSCSYARDWVSRGFRRLKDKISACGESDLALPLPPGPLLGGAPRYALVTQVIDHTAYYRGTLATCTELLGRNPTPPFQQ